MLTHKPCSIFNSRKNHLARAVALVTISPLFVNAATLEEVIVTAQKQEQRIMEIPISVSAVTGEKINNAGINNLADMSNYVPGLHIGKGPINTTVNIRGIGSGINTGFEQSVGMYIDGVYMGRSRQFRSPFLDPQRVEVLRGPQGILFGKNTIAGAVNILSADPTVGDDLQGFVTVKAEENSTYEGSVVVSAPLSDTVAARLAIKNRQSDGHVTNKTLNQDEPEIDETTARLTILWEPTENLSVNTKLSYSDYTTDGANAVPYSSYGAVPGDPGAFAPIVYGVLMPVAAPDFTINADFDTYRDNNPTMLQANGAKEKGHRGEGTDTETTAFVVTADYVLDSGWGFTSVSAYSGYEFTDGLDSDMLPVEIINTSGNQDFDQLSQEFRFTYLEGGPFEFVGGLYYEKQELESHGGILLDGSFGGLGALIPSLPNGTLFDGLVYSAAALKGLGVPDAAIPATIGAILADPAHPLHAVTSSSAFNVGGREAEITQESDTSAIFGEVTWYFAEDLRLTVGGRYSVEGKSIDKLTWVSNDIDGLNVSCTGSVTPNCISTQTGMLAYSGTQAHHLVNKRQQDEFFDPSIKLQWDVNYDTMVYLSLSQGHKSGGYNHSPDQAVIDYTTPGPGHEYIEETAKSIEAGWKGMLANGSVQLGVSIYATEYEDLQVTTFEGTTFSVSNAAAADLMGIEAEVRWAVLDSLEIGGSLAYLDFEFKDYNTAGCSITQVAAWSVAGNVGNCFQDLSGKRNAFAPEYSGNIFADYNQELFDGVELKATVDVNFKSEMYLDYDLDENVLQPGYAKINARVALLGDYWELAMYGRNLSDKVTHSFAVDTPLTGGAYTGWVDEGRVFGAEAKYLF